MKFPVLFLALAASAASASETWDPPTGGEIGRQFPKHPRTHIISLEHTDHRQPEIKIEQIGIQRTACFGKCPIYSLIINRDGTFHYHGDEFVKRRGNWHGSVEWSDLEKVLRYAAESDYFDLADLYGDNTTDLPGTFTLVKTSTRKKVIYDYGNLGPARLVALEDMIDHLLDGAKWKRD